MGRRQRREEHISVKAFYMSLRRKEPKNKQTERDDWFAAEREVDRQLRADPSLLDD
jgi:hypothetical protein